MTDERSDRQPWPMRAAMLLGVGALFGLLFDALVRTSALDGVFGSWTEDPVRLSLATLVAVGGLVLAFTLERHRWEWSVGFAALAGGLLALVFYWNGSPDGGGADEVWRFVSGLLAVAIAAPLFQTIRDEPRWPLDYTAVHAHSWTNVVLWFAAWAFVLITLLLVLLLSALFGLIGIDLLEDALEKSWFVWMLVCGALGGAIGLLRDRDRVLGLLQRVVTNVLSVLAPVLAVGLVLFVAALPFTGLGALWDQTRMTTPILLSCIIGAIILINAVIGNAPEEEARAAPLRWSAMALAAVMLPLALVAAVSTGLRVAQHGFTPSRLWAATFIAIALAYALFYLLALLLRRAGWADGVRRYNIALAIGVCAVALLLATPLLSFGAISARDQLARLESGRVAPDRFDWAAMRFDFGPAGVRALERLRDQGGSPQVRSAAATALQADSRWPLARAQRADEQRIRILPPGTAIPQSLRSRLANSVGCGPEAGCILLYDAGSGLGVLVEAGSCGHRGEHGPFGITEPVSPDCEPSVRRFYRDGERWFERVRRARQDEAESEERARRLAEAARQGRIELRTVPRRQVFIGDEPVGEPFE